MQAPHETLPAPLTGLAGLLGLPTFLEARAGLEYLRLLNDPVWRRRESPAAASRPVLLVPGFMATPASLAPMRQWFQRQGCNAQVASVGLNAGPSASAAQVVLENVRRMAAESGQRVLVVGHSRGGQHARVAAVRAPEAVEVLVTLGTPLRVMMQLSLRAWSTHSNGFTTSCRSRLRARPPRAAASRCPPCLGVVQDRRHRRLASLRRPRRGEPSSQGQPCGARRQS